MDRAGIDERRRRCTLHASAQGWSINKVFVDDGMSVLRDERPGLGDLRECIAMVQVVLAADPARIARDPAVIDDLGRSCELNDARLKYVGYRRSVRVRRCSGFSRKTHSATLREAATWRMRD